MKNATRKLPVLLFLLFSATLAHAASCLVVSVSDGDTLSVVCGNRQRRVKVRLAGIDAPELRQRYGHAAKKSLAALCHRKTAEILVQDIDAYGRAVGQVFCAGIDAGAAQVKSGLAWSYRRYLKTPYLLDLENEARRQRRGLWAAANPLPPWTWRRLKARRGYR
ncbi:MAG: thermonuclease family protein [Candidatus Accumulibacter sp.]|jgi:endonuclease YncB( thermonuclease family)|nr:thermonuclease family protein [Accumulibacter sp.]